MPAGTTDRNRTGTPSRTSDFKSEASTYFATVASLVSVGRIELPLHAPKARVIPFHYTEWTWLRRQDSHLRSPAYETGGDDWTPLLRDILSILGKNRSLQFSPQRLMLQEYAIMISSFGIPLCTAF